MKFKKRKDDTITNSQVSKKTFIVVCNHCNKALFNLSRITTTEDTVQLGKYSYVKHTQIDKSYEIEYLCPYCEQSEFLDKIEINTIDFIKVFNSLKESNNSLEKLMEILL